LTQEYARPQLILVIVLLLCLSEAVTTIHFWASWTCTSDTSPKHLWPVDIIRYTIKL